MCERAHGHMCRSAIVDARGQLAMVLSLHRAGPGVGTQGSRRGTRCLYLLSHLPDPKVLSE